MCEIVEVLGHEDLLRTWVSDVVFLTSLTQDQLVVMKVLMQQKPFHFGLCCESGRHIVVMHSSRERVRRSQCISALRDVFKVARVEAIIQKTVTFNCFHLELMGFRPNPGPVIPKTNEAVVELDEDEEEKIWEDLLPSDDEKPICLADVDEAFGRALKQKREDRLATRQTASSSSCFPTAPTEGPLILWCTAAPERLEVAPQRILREWQKLEWALLRCESAEMRLSPTLEHFVDFYAVYKVISTVQDDGKMLQHAFDTFALHVKQATGKTVLKTELSEKMLRAIRKIIPGKHCQACGRTLVEELIMDADGAMVRKHVHGMFCGHRCAKGRCKGCSFSLDEQKKCVKRCGIRWRGMVRPATWREYFEQYPRHEREAKSWCGFKLATSSREFLDSTMDFVSYGGHYHVSPDAFF
jgi:hypothetical protein